MISRSLLECLVSRSPQHIARRAQFSTVYVCFCRFSSVFLIQKQRFSTAFFSNFRRINWTTTESSKKQDLSDWLRWFWFGWLLIIVVVEVVIIVKCTNFEETQKNIFEKQKNILVWVDWFLSYDRIANEKQSREKISIKNWKKVDSFKEQQSCFWKTQKKKILEFVFAFWKLKKTEDRKKKITRIISKLKKEEKSIPFLHK